MRSKVVQTTLAVMLMAGVIQNAHAALVTEVVFKLSESSTTKLNAYTGWTTAGGFNEGIAGAAALVDNGIDFKSTTVDLWPGDITSVRVAMYAQGIEQAFIEFDPTGTTNTSFFSEANVVDSSWTDLTGVDHNYFSIAGHVNLDRHWFVNTNYGGCSTDVGHIVVIDSDGTQPCQWETDALSATDRAFLYSASNMNENWTSGEIGAADVFAVSVTRRVQNPDGAVPVPATLALFAVGLGVFGYQRRRLFHT